jgi:hypothetical protein
MRVRGSECGVTAARQRDHASVAQSEEQDSLKVKVVGSRPTRRTIIKRWEHSERASTCRSPTHLITSWRSLVAHKSGGLGVAGSNPADVTNGM